MSSMAPDSSKQSIITLIKSINLQVSISGTPDAFNQAYFQELSRLGLRQVIEGVDARSALKVLLSTLQHLAPLSNNPDSVYNPLIDTLVRFIITYLCDGSESSDSQGEQAEESTSIQCSDGPPATEEIAETTTYASVVAQSVLPRPRPPANPSGSAKKGGKSSIIKIDQGKTIQYSLPPALKSIVCVDLHQSMKSRKVLYPSFCKKRGCEFCFAMFFHTAVTSCSIHGGGRCHPCGYFPHVGVKLWNLVKRSHDGGKAYNNTRPADQSIKNLQPALFSAVTESDDTDAGYSVVGSDKRSEFKRRRVLEEEEQGVPELHDTGPGPSFHRWQALIDALKDPDEMLPPEEWEQKYCHVPGYPE